MRRCAAQVRAHPCVEDAAAERGKAKARVPSPQEVEGDPLRAPEVVVPGITAVEPEPLAQLGDGVVVVVNLRPRALEPAGKSKSRSSATSRKSSRYTTRSSWR